MIELQPQSTKFPIVYVAKLGFCFAVGFQGYVGLLKGIAWAINHFLGL